MDVLVFAFFFLAVVIGYLLGYWQRGRKKLDKRFSSASEQRYIEGLNQLLNERPDAAIDTFISALDVNEKTLETHFALGALWRRRGEVERAIRVHQNLMSRSNLDSEHLEQAQLELGLDYTRSGLLDRAEALFKLLSASAYAPIKTSALQNLVKIYEQEQEWNRAIEAAEALCHKKLKNDVLYWRHMQAHYCCELAEPLMAAGSNEEARAWLALARAYDRQHPRLRITTARLDLATGHALQSLRLLRQLDNREAYLIEAVPMVIEGYSLLNNEAAAREYLADLYQQTRLPGLLPFMADRAYADGGDRATIEFIVQELRTNESHGHIAQLFDTIGTENISFSAIRPVLTERLGFAFHCRNCGFEGAQLHWRCPSCMTWI